MNSTAPVGTILFEPVTVAVNVTCPSSVAGEGDATSVIVDVFRCVPDGATSCTNTGEMLGGTELSPRYRAVIACAPAASADVDSRAVVPVSEAVPRGAAPSENATLPVAPAGAVSVAVSETVDPLVEGSADDVTATVDDVDEVLTTCVIDCVLPAKLGSPE